MSQTNLADPDVVAESDQEVIDVPDDSASQSAGNKRAPGRPASDAWNNFKRIPNPNPGNSKRPALQIQHIRASGNSWQDVAVQQQVQGWSHCTAG